MAYKYVGGLKGFAITDDKKLVWRDTARGWQHYAFGGAVNQDRGRACARGTAWRFSNPTAARLPSSRHRTNSSSRAKSKPISATCITARTARTASRIGVRQPDREVGAKPWGISDAVWNRRVGEVARTPE